MNPEKQTAGRIGKLVLVALVVLLVLTVWMHLPSRNSECTPAECRYDLNALKKTDTNLLIRAGAHWIKPSLSNLTALAVGRDDRLAVGSNSGVEVLKSNGERLSVFGVDEPVHCLAVAPDGDLLVGLKDHIEIYAANGVRKAVWKCPEPKAELTSLSMSSNAVYAADHVNRVVWRFSWSGDVLGQIRGRDATSAKSGFVVPSAFFDVAVAADQSVWVANPGMHRLEHFTPEGMFLSCWGSESLQPDGFCGCCNPSNIALTPGGNFVTSEKHIVRVKLYDHDGLFTGIISGQEDWAKDAVGLDLAVDSRGRIYVLDPCADVVRWYSK